MGMTRKIFIWVAHPRAGSLCAAMATAYADQARAAGAEVRRMDLSEMSFDAAFEGYTGNRKTLEPDLVAWQEAIKWADHVLFIHPYWWGAMPAQAKAVLDQALIPGFGFNYIDGKLMTWEKHLTGKTAGAIITSDTPPWLDTLLYRRPARRVLRNQVFKFVGMVPRKIVQFGSVKMANREKIGRWIAATGQMGALAAKGAA